MRQPVQSPGNCPHQQLCRTAVTALVGLSLLLQHRDSKVVLQLERRRVVGGCTRHLVDYAVVKVPHTRRHVLQARRGHFSAAAGTHQVQNLMP